MDADEPFRLSDKIALITGSTRGIGRAIAEEFAEAGARVVITGRNLTEAEAVATGLRRSGHEAFAFAYDAGEAGAGRELIRALASQLPRLDILVNNAAILRPHTIARLDEDEFDEIFRVNTRAALFLCQAAHSLLKQGASSCVVNLTAACAHRPMPGIGAYCASKAAMLNLTSTLAQEWGREGIRVNALTPGSVATDMILPKDPAKREAFEREMAGQNLVGRLADPREIARAARFLASPAASYMTGQTLVVDGGLLA
jgi:NAD(P)-dependent dehydrogenase (short-subunit alcohol dehydrogenase family)